MAEEEEEFQEETDEEFFGSVGQVVDRASLPDAILTASRRPPLEAVVCRSNPHASPVARRGG